MAAGALRRVPTSRRGTFLVHGSIVLMLLGGWWIFAASVNPLLFPTPPRVWDAYLEMLASGELLTAASTTAWTFGVSLAIAITAGLAVALLAARVPAVASVTDPYIVALYSTPVIVMVPLIILWIGVGDLGRITIVVVGAFPPIYINAVDGLRDARPDLLEVAASFGASERDLLREVIVPGALPYLAAGLRIALGRALAAIVVAEIFLSLSGLGGLIQSSVGFLRIDKTIAAALLLSAAGTITMKVMTRLERRLEPWRTA